MEMHITPGWLRNKIETTSEAEIEEGIEAGVPITSLESLNMFLTSDLTVVVDEARITHLKHAFGVLIRNLRLKKNITVDKLAEFTSINEDELRLIECDPHYLARPRTVHQLATFFGIKIDKMMEIACASHVLNEELEEVTLKFAAKSDGVSSLNKDEQRILNEYVKFLNES